MRTAGTEPVPPVLSEKTVPDATGGTTSVSSADSMICSKNRHGVALIIVLGLVVLLTLLGFSFVIFMRTENMSAGIYRQDVVVRQAIQVALARAISDLDNSQGEAAYPLWRDDNAMLSVGSDIVVPLSAMTNPINGMVFTNTYTIPRGSMTNDPLKGMLRYLPNGAFIERGFHQAGDGLPQLMLNTGLQFTVFNRLTPNRSILINLTQRTSGLITNINSTSQAGWVQVGTTNDSGGVRWNQNDRYAAIPAPDWVPQIMPVPSTGIRYAYLIFNCSGLLDANEVGDDPQSRKVGQTPKEIPLNNLSGIEISSIPQFISQRDGWGPYETLEELSRKNNGLRSWPDSLVNYSRIPQGNLIITNGERRVVIPEYIGGDGSAWSSVAIKKAFADAGISTQSVDAVYNALVDYVDTNSIPADLASPCTEAVPMFNEVWIRNRLTITTGLTYSVNNIFAVRFEVAYPFYSLPASSSYTMDYSIQWGMVGGGPTWLLPATNPTVGTLTIPAITGKNYYQLPPLNIAITNNDSAAVLSLLGASYRVAAEVKIEIKDAQGKRVDATPWPTNTIGVRLRMPDVTYAIPATIASPLVNTWEETSECIDPRFNWQSGTAYWKTGAVSSLQRINLATSNYWVQADSSDPRSDAFNDTMYVANRPLKSVSELSYLIRDSSSSGRWDTIHLIGNTNAYSATASYKSDNVLDYFTLETNAFLRGKVNPNTENPRVLASLFENMPIDQYPDQVGAPKFTVDYDLAWRMADFWLLTNYSGWKEIATRQDLADRCSNLIYNAASPLKSALIDPSLNEAIIRNLEGLVNSRQQYFIIALYAQSYAMPNNLNVGINFIESTTRRAIAEVWRDPYPSPPYGLPPNNGQRGYIVRRIAFINE